MSEESKKNKKMAAAALAYGVELVVVLMVGLFVGKWFGEKWAHAPEWGAVVGCFAGFTVWTWRMARLQKKNSSSHKQ